MRLDNFSVTVAGGNERENGYVELNHGQQYSVLLSNHLNRRCAAEVTVDGKHVGTFRLQAYGQLSLERPTNENGRFTFYEDGTPEFTKAGIDKVAKSDRGLVSVTFKPEKERRQEVEPIRPWPNPWDNERRYALGSPGPIGTADADSGATVSFNAGGQNTNSIRQRGISGQSVSYGDQSVTTTQSVKSGGTGLSGSSGQRFRTVGNLDYDDASTFRTINLRLVGANKDPRPLTDVSVKATPIPTPVG